MEDFVDQDVKKILSILHEKKELPEKAGEGEFERGMRRGSNACLVLAFACLPVLGMAAGILAHSPQRSLELTYVGLGAAGVMVVAALLWPILDVAPIVWSLLRYSTYAYERGKLALSHDFRNAEELVDFELPVLQLADKWLLLHIERMKLRLGIFLGGSDKVAIFALAGTGWTAWHNLRTIGSSWEDTLYTCALAFLAGLAIGGMLMNSLIKKLSYQRDLLAIAIQRKAQG
jgi:hypothetical protein